jgi:hypothetical protein
MKQISALTIIMLNVVTVLPEAMWHRLKYCQDVVVV